MGDLESGIEEMEGVKLGYLVIKGKQMFALSQVFTDLLKNIPRTTVHKRMDHLNVKKHHCDLEELRKLKAINSIAFHAAKCTLISREDVEALYVSCKTERVLRSKRSKLKLRASSCTSSSCYSKGVWDGGVRPDSRRRLWEEKVWLSLQGISQPFGLRSKYELLPPASALPHIYSHSLLRSVVCARQPVLYQSAITLSGAAEVTYKRRGQPEATRYFRRRLVLLPTCCKPTSKVHLGAPESCCSSDTESSSFSGRAEPDSDFGSSLSTSSNSDTSEEEEDSASESSEATSDDDSSSESDSSSVSSQVSLQSIRFRRARLLSQPTFLYEPSLRKGPETLAGKVESHPPDLPRTRDNKASPQQKQAAHANNSKKDAKITSTPKPPPPISIVKSEPEDPSIAPPSSSSSSPCLPPSPHHVKIKVEENLAEYNSDYRCGFEEKPGEFKSTLNNAFPGEGEYKNGARVRKNYRTLVLGKQASRGSVKGDRGARSAGKGAQEEEEEQEEGEEGAGATKRKRGSSGPSALNKRPFNFIANFPTPPSLTVGTDGDLCPAYSLNSSKEKCPHRCHPVWKWQLGGAAVPLPPSYRFRKF